MIGRVHSIIRSSVGLYFHIATFTTPRYDISRLQDPRTKSVLQLRNRSQALSNIDEQDSEEEDTLNQQWKQVRNIFDGASKTYLGMQKTRRKERMDYRSSYFEFLFFPCIGCHFLGSGLR